MEIKLLLRQRHIKFLLELLCIVLLCSSSFSAQSATNNDSFEIPSGVYHAQFVESKNDIAVIQFSGNYDRTLPDDSFNAAARAVVAREFYQHHPDNYDFLVVFSSFEFNAGDALAFHLGVSNDISGIGLEKYSNAELYGSDGELKGYTDMAALQRYEASPFTANRPSLNDNFNLVLRTLAHETLHQWASHTDIPEFQGKDDGHWSFFLDTDGSVEYGHDWQDNGDGTFTARSAGQNFSPLDLYLMGMHGADQVPDTFVITPDSDDYSKQDLPKPGITISGVRNNYSIEDFISVHGPRVPSADKAQKVFRYAFIYLTEVGKEISSIELAKIDNIRKAYRERFSIMTGGKGIARVYPDVQTPVDTGSYEVITDPSGNSTTDLDMGLAITWLQSQQLANGSWVDKPATIMRDTVEAHRTLTEFNSQYAGSANAQDWIQQQAPHNVDSMARILSQQTTSHDLAATLSSKQHTDGGWGLTGHFQSNALDTALAICALAEHTQSSDQTQKAIDYLYRIQHADGGWGAIDALSSVSVTAEVLQALKCVNQTSPNIDKALTWLLTESNSDHGYGTEGSTVHETAQVLITLLLYEMVERIDSEAVLEYLTGLQNASGSWEGSVYTTALVVRSILAASLPNVLVQTIKQTEETVRDGDFVELIARVSNHSPERLEPNVVRFYLGNPAEGGSQFAHVSLPAIAPFTSMNVSSYWNSFGHSGEQTIFVVADADQQIVESSESDNTLTHSLYVNPAPIGVDLSVSDSEFVISRDSNNILPTTLGLMATVRNIGNQQAQNTLVQLWQGDPQQEGVLIDSKAISVAARDSVGINFSDTLEQPGVVEYRLIVDANNAHTEVNENNNTATARTGSVDGIDLEVLPSDIQINPAPAFLNGVVEFTVNIKNNGTVTTPNSRVVLAVQNDQGETEIQSQSLILEPAQEQQLTASWVADFEGDNRLIVYIDPDNQIAEVNESNNTASVPFNVHLAQGTNLSVNYRDLAFNPNPGLEGFGATLSAVVRNTGSANIASADIAFYDGNPNSGGRLIDRVTVTGLASASSQNIQVTWPQIPDDSTRFIYLVADPDQQLAELDEADNVAFTKYSVKSLPDFDISSSSIQVQPAFPKINQSAQFTITITNRGKQMADDVVVRVYDGSDNSGALLVTEQLAIPGSGEASLQLTHRFTQRGSNALFVEVDPTNAIEESNENNNTATRNFTIQDGDFYVSHRFVSPDGNGINDTVEYVFNLPTETQVSVVVLNKYHDEVAQFSIADKPVLNGSVNWDGRNQLGGIVADGTYHFAVKDSEGHYQGQRSVILDTNRSALSEAIGTGFELNRNLSCRIGEVQRLGINNSLNEQAHDTLDIVYSPDDQFIYFTTYLEPYYDAEGILKTTNEFVFYPSGLYRALNDGTGVVQLTSDETIKVQTIQNMVVSPNGQNLAVLTRIDDATSGSSVYELWNVDAQNGGADKIHTETSDSYAKTVPQINYINNNEIIYLVEDYSNNQSQLWRVVNQPSAVPELITDIYANYGTYVNQLSRNQQGTHSLLSLQSDAYYGGIRSSQDMLDTSRNQFPVVLVDMVTKQSQLISNTASAHKWSPTGQSFAIADNTQTAINVVDLNGVTLQTIDFSTLQLAQFTSQQQATLNAYFASLGYDLGSGLVGRVTAINWNPDASEFAFVIEDHLASFINSDGCYRGGIEKTSLPNTPSSPWSAILEAIIPQADAAVIGEQDHCLAVPENVRALFTEYTPIDGIYIASLIDSSVTQVAVNNHLDANGYSYGGDDSSNEPLYALTDNQYDFPVTDKNLPYISWAGASWGVEVYGPTTPLRQIRWLQGARELLITNGESAIGNQHVLLNLDNPAEDTRHIFPERNMYYEHNRYKSGVYPSNAGKFLPFYSDDEADICLANKQTQGYRQFQSLLNLTADLRVRKSPEQGGFLLEGTAADKYFDYYQLEYADVNTPNSWQAIAPASNMLVIDDRFTNWIPPYIGNFYVRLSTYDKAGNQRQEIKLVNNSERASISGVYITPAFFSPNGDGIKDQASLHFKVLENVNLEVEIYNQDKQLVRSISNSYDVIGSEQQIAWDGRDNNGFIVKDGTYRVVVQRYEFFTTVDNTPPVTHNRTEYLFTPPANTKDQTCRFTPHEQITADDDELNGCRVVVDKNLKAGFSDNGVLEDIKLEQKLDQDADWQLSEFEPVLISTDNGVSIASIIEQKSLNELADYQYRFVVSDQAGNRSISQVDDQLKRNRAHITPGSHHGFGYRDHPGYGNKDYYLYPKFFKEGEEIEFVVTESAKSSIISVEVLYKEIDAQAAYQTSVPESFTAKDGKVQFNWDTSQYFHDTQKSYQLRIRLTTADNTVLLTDGIEYNVTPQDIPIGFWGIVWSGELSDSGHNAHFYDSLHHPGLHVKPIIKLPRHKVHNVTLTIKSTGPKLDPRFATETVLLDKSEGLAYDRQLYFTYYDFYDPDLQLINECGYKYTIIAQFEADEGTFSTSTGPDSKCDVFRIDSITPVLSETCNAGPTQLVDVALGLKLYNKELKPILLQLAEDKGNGELGTLYINENLPKSAGYKSRFDTSNLPEGDYPLAAVLTYEDGSKKIKRATVPIVHSPPAVDITYPAHNDKVCAAEYQDSRSEPDILARGVETQGVVSSTGPDACVQLKTQAPGQASVSQARFYDAEDFCPPDVAGRPEDESRTISRVVDGSIVLLAELAYSPQHQELRSQGVLGVPYFKQSGVHQFTLQASNWSGALQCQDINVEVDADVEVTNVTMTGALQVSPPSSDSPSPYPPYFSPNGDGSYDQIKLDYLVGETVEVTIDVYSQQRKQNSRTLEDAEKVATITQQQTVLAGQQQWIWGGTDDGNQLLPDGVYRIAITSVDGCGLTRKDQLYVGIDTTPPQLQITSPVAGDNLPLQIRVLGRVQDTHPGLYQLTVSDGSTDPQIIAANTGNQDGQLGEWNSFGREGVWVLQLKSQDALGNEAILQQQFALPVRQQLISSHTTSNYFVSPNDDTRLDELLIRTSFDKDVLATFSIVDQAQSVIKTLIQNQQYPPGYTTLIWDGKDQHGERVADGVYRVQVTAEGAGNVQTEHVSFEVDTTPPAIVLNQLQAGYIELAGGQQITGSITDRNFQDYQVSLVSPANAEGDNLILQPQQIAFSDQAPVSILAELPDSLREYEQVYEVTILARDKAGNTPSTTPRMVVDLFPPRVDIEHPAQHTVYNSAASPVSIQGIVKDKFLKHYQVSVAPTSNPDDNTIIHQSTDNTEHTLADWDLAGLDDGIYTITVQASDRGGLTTEKTRQLIVDNQAPDAAINQPANHAYLTELRPIIGVANDDHFEQYSLSIANGHVSENGSYNSLITSNNKVENDALFNWNALPADGPYTFKLLVNDQAGNQTTVYQPFIIDTLPPATPELLSVEFDKDKEQIRIEWKANTEPDLAGYELYRNGNKITADLLTELNYIDTGLPEGEYRYHIKAVDKAGLHSDPSNSLSVLVDLTPPTVLIASPTDNQKVNLLVDILGTAYSENDFKHYQLYAGQSAGSLVLIRQSSLPIQADQLAQWDTLGLTDNTPYLLRLIAEDTSGNTAQDEVWVEVDNTPPAAPENLQISVSNGNEAALTWQYTGNDSDLEGFLLYRNGKLVNASSPILGDLTPYAIPDLNYDDLGLNDGEYDYIVYAIDQAGNISPPSNVANATIDLRPPQAILSNIIDGQAFDDSLYLLAHSDDIDIASVSLQYRASNESDWTELTLDYSLPYDYQWNTEALEYGEYQLRAVAVDNDNKTDPDPEIKDVVKQDLQPPAQVQGLTVKVDGNVGTLSWDANTETDLIGYQIYYTRCQTCPASDYLVLNDQPVTDTEYQHTVTLTTQYSYFVVAMDQAQNESAESDRLTGIYVDTLASVERYITTDAASTLSLTLSELYPTAATFDQVTLVTTNPPATQNIALDQALTDTQLAVTHNQKGLFKVTATAANQTAHFVASPSEDIVIAVTEQPSKPTGLQGAYDNNNQAISLQWLANPEAEKVTGYKIYRNDHALEENLLINDASASANTGSGINNILPSSSATAYWRAKGDDVMFAQNWTQARLVKQIELDWYRSYYRATGMAVYALIEGEYFKIQDVANQTSDKTVIPLTTPVVTTSIQIRVNQWASSYYGGRLQQMRIIADNLYDTDHFYQDKPDDGYHTYHIQAINQYGIASELSEPSSPVPYGDVDPPEAVTLSVQVDQATAQLSWSDSADAVSYNLYRDDVLIHTVFATHYDDADLPNGTYHYQVTAVDAAGNESAKSNTVEAVINTPLLPSPVNLTATADNAQALIQLNWQTTAQAASYRIYRSLQSDSGFDLLASDSQTHYQDDSVIADTTYYYYVTAVDQYGNQSASSNVVNAQIIDQTAPQAPIISYPVDSTTAYLSADRYVNISGFAEAGAQVYLMHQGQFLTDSVTAHATAQLTELKHSHAGEFDHVVVSHSGRVFGLWQDALANQHALLEYTQGSWQTAAGSEHLIPAYITSMSVVNQEDLLIQMSGGSAYILDTDSGELTELNIDSDTVQIVSIINHSRLNHTLTALARVNGTAEALYQFDLNTGQATALPDHYQYRVSPDNRYFLYTEFVNDSTVPVYLLDTVTQQTRTITVSDTNIDQIFSLKQTWSNDSTKIMLSNNNTVSDNQQLFIYHLETDHSVTIDNADQAISQAAFYGTQRVVYSSLTQTNQPVLIEVNWVTGQQQVLSDLNTPLHTNSQFLAMTDRGIAYFHNTDNNTFYRYQPAGHFEFEDVLLEEGENYFTAVAVDQARNISDASNSITVIFQPTPLPDYQLNVTVNPHIPLVNKHTNLAIQISNVSDVLAQAAQLRVVAYAPDNSKTDLSEQIIGQLQAHSSITVNLPWQPSQAGEYTLSVIIDSNNQVVELDESNNSRIVTVNVLANADPTLALALDSSQAGNHQFNNNQALTGQATVLNPGEAFSGQLIIEVVDNNGTLVETIKQTAINELAYAGEITEPFAWNTADYYPGNYRVRARLLDLAQAPIRDAEANFEITDTLQLLLGLRSDAYYYRVNQNVRLTATTTNNSRSTVFAGGDLSLEITSPDAQRVYQESKQIAELLTTESSNTDYLWNTAFSAPGDYQATVTLQIDGQTTLQSTTRFTILPSDRTLAGDLQIDNTVLSINQPLLFTYQLHNVGNSQINNINLAYSIVQGNTNLKTLTDPIATLNVGQQLNGNRTFNNLQLVPGSYQLVLNATLTQSSGETVTQQLDQQGFDVIETHPPETLIENPAENAVVNGLKTDAHVIATDDSGVDKVEVKFDNADWFEAQGDSTQVSTYPVALDRLPEGTHKLSVRAQDNMGYESNMAERRFTIDNTPPMVTFANIQANQVFNTALTPDVQVTDPHLDNYTLTLNGVDITQTTRIDTNGSYNLVVNAVDLAGNAIRHAIRFTVNIETDQTINVDAKDDQLFMHRGAWGSINVLANDVYDSHHQINITIAQPPQHGNLIETATGAYNYFPTRLNYIGQDSFSYRIEDTTNNSNDTATVMIDVGPGISCSTVPHHSTQSDQDVNLPGWAREQDAYDPPKYKISIVRVSDPSAFVSGKQPAVDYPNCTLSYTAKPGINRTVSVTYRVLDVAQNGTIYTSRDKTFNIKIDTRDKTQATINIVPILKLLLLDQEDE